MQHWRMELTRITIVLSCLVMALTLTPNLTCAQNTPQDFLNAHTPSRAEVGEPPLVWNETLVAYAQAYANTRKDCALIHSNGPYGENIAYASWDVSAKEAVGWWTEEKPYYDYSSNSCLGGQECLHYTQVVWRKTTSVGCARAPCHQKGWTFVTCNYYPPGNYIGERPY